MTKLTDTQTMILTAGAQRPDNLAMPLPKGLHGAAAKMAVAKMISHGWLQEVVRALRYDELSAGPLNPLSPPLLRRCWSGSVISPRRTSDAAALTEPSL